MAWLGFDSAVSSATRTEVSAWLQRHGVPAQSCAHLPPASGEPGLLLVHEAEAGEPLVRQASAHSRVLVIVMNARRPSNDALWQLLDAGALDVLWWPQLPPDASGVQARLARHADVQALIDSPRVSQQLVGRSTAWRQLLAHVVELARFSHSPVLIQGESGTGKELIARLIHDLDEQHHTGHLVVVDCTTLTPELSGSELFGHERGAFTGALNAREGAFAQAHMGTLFLDEVGDLPLPLQAQLLRVVQEKQYKRVGGNAWQQTDFRLVAATATCRPPWTLAAFAPTSTTASPASSAARPRWPSGARTCCRWPSTFKPSMAMPPPDLTNR